jgi:CDP-glycerol glycerophosphotransferase (TagB/SpsB family)
MILKKEKQKMNQTMSNEKRHPILRRVFERLITLPVRLLPLKDIMVFESHSDFCDNSKALFDYCLSQGLDKKYKMVWLVDEVDAFKTGKHEKTTFIRKKDDTLVQKILGELRRAILLGQCRYSFFTHRNFARCRPKKGQVFFNLTHGTPLKDSTGKHSDPDKSTYILTTSPFAGQLRVRTYGGGADQLQILGFPRNDLLFAPKDVDTVLGMTFSSFKKVIIWMPTFRRQKNRDRNDSGTDRVSDIPILNTEEEWHGLNQYLVERGTLLIVKLHPAQDLRFVQYIEASNIRIITNMQLQEKQVDLYSLIGCCDAMVTDYSSVYMDYLILDRPIGFTIDDLAQYTENLGFLVEKPLDYMPGERLADIKDMMRFIDQVTSGQDPHAVARAEIGRLFNTYRDGCSCTRILELLKP